MRKFLAALLLLIFIPVFILAVLFWNIRSTFLNKEFVKEELSKNNTYEFIHNDALPALTVGLSEDTLAGDAESNLFTSDDLTNLVGDIVTAEFLQTEVEKLIDSTYPYFLSQEDSFEIIVDLEKNKNQFEESFQIFAENRIENYPACTNKQLSEIDEKGITEELTCIPSGYNTDKIVKEINLSGVIEEITDEFPDKIILSEEGLQTKPKTFKLFNGEEGSIETSAEFPDLLSNIREVASIFILTSNILIGLSIIILILIALLRLTSIKSISKWLGWTLILPSSFLLLITLSSNLFILNQLSSPLSEAFSGEVSGEFSKFQETILTFFIGNSEKTGFIFQVIKDFNQLILIQMAIVFAVSLILIIIGVLLKSKQKQPEQPAQT